MKSQSRFLIIQWFTGLIITCIGCATKEIYPVIFGSIILTDFWLTVYAHRK